MNFIAIGISHHQTPESIRERYSIDSLQIRSFLHSLSEENKSILVLSTCNRLEIYLTDIPTSEAQLLWEKLLVFCKAPALENTYIYTNEQCIEHAFKVTLGLDSRIWGEHQIIGQIRQAFNLSKHAQVLSFPLQKLFEHCFQLSKSVRGKVFSKSLGEIATRYIYKNWGHCSQPILVIGAGKLITDFLSQMSLQSHFSITLCNRTPDKSLALLSKFPIIKKIIAFEELPLSMSLYNKIVLGVGSPTPFITENFFDRKSMYQVIDFGIPSALEHTTKEQPHIEITGLDSFSNGPADPITHNRLISIIKKEVFTFKSKISLYQNRDLIIQYRKKILDSCEPLLQKALLSCNKGHDPAEIIKTLAYKLQQKLLHDPSVALRQSMVQSHHLDFCYHSADAISLPPVKSFESL